MTARTLLAMLFALVLFPAIAAAQPRPQAICGARDQIVSHLEQHFGESVRSIGLAPQNRIVEVFASTETGSWTITVTTASGTTCLMASGQYFEVFQPVAPGSPL